MILFLELALPPSKNASVKSVLFYSRNQKRMINAKLKTPAVYKYREDTAKTVIEAVRVSDVVFDKTGSLHTILSCRWRRPNDRMDVVNYHDELCDAIAPPLGLNDKRFLVRDMDEIIDKNNPGVSVTIWQRPRKINRKKMGR